MGLSSSPGVPFEVWWQWEWPWSANLTPIHSRLYVIRLFAAYLLLLWLTLNFDYHIRHPPLWGAFPVPDAGLDRDLPWAPQYSGPPHWTPHILDTKTTSNVPMKSQCLAEWLVHKCEKNMLHEQMNEQIQGDFICLTLSCNACLIETHG